MKSMTRFGAWASAFLICTLTLVIVQRAYATTTVANASKTTLLVPSGGFSSAVTLATKDQPVFVQGATIRGNHLQYGIGNMSVAYDTANYIILWAGINADGSTVGTWDGTSSTTQMISVGYGVVLDHKAVALIGDVPQLVAYNSSVETVTVSLVQMW